MKSLAQNKKAIEKVIALFNHSFHHNDYAR